MVEQPVERTVELPTHKYYLARMGAILQGAVYVLNT